MVNKERKRSSEKNPRKIKLGTESAERAWQLGQNWGGGGGEAKMWRKRIGREWEGGERGRPVWMWKRAETGSAAPGRSLSSSSHPVRHECFISPLSNDQAAEENKSGENNSLKTGAVQNSKRMVFRIRRLLRAVLLLLACTAH